MRVLVFAIILMFCASTTSSPLSAATTAQVKQGIATGADYLKTVIEKSHGGEKTLVALALYKAGLPKTSPEIQGALSDVLKKFDGDTYKPGGEHIYEAGVELTLLVDMDYEKYKREVQMLVDYIVGQQKSNGGWDYPGGGHGESAVGDTSLIQYALLGLWSAERAGVKVDPTVWVKTLEWHARYQSQDGGFAYCPGVKTGDGNGASTLNMSVNAVGSMHIAMLHLNPTFLPLSDAKPKSSESPENAEKSAKFGVLEAVEIDEPNMANTVSTEIPENSVAAVRRAFGYVTARFRVENTETGNKIYYYYSLERMAALANIQKIGSHDWFNECADFLLTKQNGNGSWKMSKYYGDNVDTAFVVLFLTRSTGKLLKRIPPPDPIGDGLLAGGRGLPDDLSDAQYDGRTMKEKPKPTEPLDKLLASLGSTGEINIADVQKQIVENVQLGDRETLIGQIDQLVKLVDHPDPEVRRTVAWALGRTDNMDLARHLILGLSDKDVGVMIESRNALCWLSRKTKGFGLPEDPLANVAANATAQQKSDAVASWHKTAVLRWGEWYLSNRPFEDRGDEFEAKLRAKMEQLKSGG